MWFKGERRDRFGTSRHSSRSFILDAVDDGAHLSAYSDHSNEEALGVDPTRNDSHHHGTIKPPVHCVLHHVPL